MRKSFNIKSAFPAPYFRITLFRFRFLSRFFSWVSIVTGIRFESFTTAYQDWSSNRNLHMVFLIPFSERSEHMRSRYGELSLMHVTMISNSISASMPGGILSDTRWRKCALVIHFSQISQTSRPNHRSSSQDLRFPRWRSAPQ